MLLGVAVGVSVGVAVGVRVGVLVGVAVGVVVGVCVGVLVGVFVGVLVDVGVGVAGNDQLVLLPRLIDSLSEITIVVPVLLLSLTSTNSIVRVEGGAICH